MPGEGVGRGLSEEILERLLSPQESLPPDVRERLGPAVAGTYDSIIAFRGSRLIGDADSLQHLVGGLGHMQETACRVVADIVRSRGDQATMAVVRNRLIEMTECTPTTATAWIEGCVGNGVVTDPPGSDLLRLRTGSEGAVRS